MPLYQNPNVHQHVLSQFSLKGKVVLITGGSRGIGLEIVKGMAESGASVALIYNTTSDAPQKAKKIARENGVRVQAYQTDVSIKDAVSQTIIQIHHDFGALDVVVANAGVCSNVKALDYTESSWEAINKVNYNGVMWTAIAAGQVFKRQGRGNLIITASVSSVLVNVPQEQAAYNASKAAVAHLGKNLAVEWADFAQVNCVSPGYINTESKTSMHSLKTGAITDTQYLVVSKQPAELMSRWLSMVPGGRVAEPAELKGVCIALVLQHAYD